MLAVLPKLRGVGYVLAGWVAALGVDAGNYTERRRYSQARSAPSPLPPFYASGKELW